MCVPHQLANPERLLDNGNMSAAEVIEQIKELPPAEREQVARFVLESPSVCRKVSISTIADGLPLIRAASGTITSQLIHDIESLAP